MALSAGSQIGSYTVTAKIGEGGMGQVYQATDTKLNRQVALKILPEAFAQDPDRLARFQREAQVLASLNHPNIAAIHGLEDSEGTKALVLELVEGPTLADRIAKGPIPLDEALPIAKQIAEALEAAHEAGVIHRDLKPANIKVREDGTVKVLDFGLAKALDPTPEGDPSQSPTLTAAATQMGVIMGTAAYMSPEQARGKPVDKRADIWAFGCVLYEMLAGTKPFPGDDVSQTLARVIDRDADWTLVPKALPHGLITYLQRCLEKDPRQRVRDIGDVRLAIEGAFTPPESPVASPRRGRERVWMLTAGVLALLAVGLAIRNDGIPSVDTMPARFKVPEVSLAKGTVYSFRLAALSPDGRHLAFSNVLGGPGIWLRSVDAEEPRLLSGTEGATRLFWSPDSRHIGFYSIDDRRLEAVEFTGGPARTFCDPPQLSWGTWNRDGVILFSTVDQLFRCSESGGGPTPVMLDGNSSYGLQPQFLPDGDHFLFVRTDGPEGPGVYVGSLASGEISFVVHTVFKAQYAPPGYLLFVRGTALVAQRFDLDTLQLSGDALILVQDIGVIRSLGVAMFSVSDSGGLTYHVGGSLTTSRFVWLDRAGMLLESIGESRDYDTFSVSPDETRLVAEVADRDVGTADLWILDMTADRSQRLTFDPADDRLPIWSADGESVIFASNRNGGPLQLWQKAASGAGEPTLLLASNEHTVPIATHGGHVVFSFGENTQSGSGRVGTLALSGDREPLAVDLTRGNYSAYQHDLSPDGRWIAYASDESGQTDVWVQPFPPSGGKWQVSVEGRSYPRWSADGTELFFLGGGAASGVHVVDVATEGDEFSAGRAGELFHHTLRLDTRRATRGYYVAKDGRLLANVYSDLPADPLVWVLDWVAGLD